MQSVFVFELNANIHTKKNDSHAKCHRIVQLCGCHSCGWLPFFKHSTREKKLTNFGCFKRLLSIKGVCALMLLTRFAYVFWTKANSCRKILLILNTCYGTIFVRFFFVLFLFFLSRFWNVYFDSDIVSAGILCKSWKFWILNITFWKGKRDNSNSNRNSNQKKNHTKWNKLLEFYLSIWAKVLLSISHLWVRFRFYAPTQFFTFSASVVQSDAMFLFFIFSLSLCRCRPRRRRWRRCCCHCRYFFLSIRSFRWTTFLFKFFRITRHSDGVKRTGTFRNSPEKSTHMQIFSIAPEI